MGGTRNTHEVDVKYGMYTIVFVMPGREITPERRTVLGRRKVLGRRNVLGRRKVD
jgi:hypothetical protein